MRMRGRPRKADSDIPSRFVSLKLTEVCFRRLKLIGVLYRMDMPEIIQNALAVYADKLKLHETVLQEFPVPEPQPQEGRS